MNAKNNATLQVSSRERASVTIKTCYRAFFFNQQGNQKKERHDTSAYSPELVMKQKSLKALIGYPIEYLTFSAILKTRLAAPEMDILVQRGHWGGEYPVPQYSKKIWQILKYHVKIRRNTDIAFRSLYNRSRLLKVASMWRVFYLKHVCTICPFILVTLLVRRWQVNAKKKHRVKCQLLQ